MITTNLVQNNNNDKKSYQLEALQKSGYVTIQSVIHLRFFNSQGTFKKVTFLEERTRWL